MSPASADRIPSFPMSVLSLRDDAPPENAPRVRDPADDAGAGMPRKSFPCGA